MLCAGADSYKWILYGEDDTVFFLDNIIKVLSNLDHSQPYLLSDALWWPEHGKGTATLNVVTWKVLVS